MSVIHTNMSTRTMTLCYICSYLFGQCWHKLPMHPWRSHCLEACVVITRSQVQSRSTRNYFCATSATVMRNYSYQSFAASESTTMTISMEEVRLIHLNTHTGRDYDSSASTHTHTRAVITPSLRIHLNTHGPSLRLIRLAVTHIRAATFNALRL